MTSPEEVLNGEIKALEEEIFIYEQLAPIGYTQEDLKTMARLNPLYEAKKKLSYLTTLQSILAIVPIRELTEGRLETDFSSGHREGHNSLLSEVRALIEKGTTQ